MRLRDSFRDLSWESERHYGLLGRQLRIRSTSIQAVDPIYQFLSMVAVCIEDVAQPAITFSVVNDPTSGGADPAFVFFREGVPVGSAPGGWRLVRLFEYQLDLFLETVESCLLLHAGAVAKDGIGILIPGRSGSGKSSLSLALALAGYRYLSDEVAVLAPSTRMVHSFPKPITLKSLAPFAARRASLPLWLGPLPEHSPHHLKAINESRPIWYISLADGAGCGGSPVPVRYIIFPQYDANMTSRLCLLSPGQAMRRLLSHVINLQSFGGEGVSLLAGLLRESQCFSLPNNDLETTVSLVNGLTDSADHDES